MPKKSLWMSGLTALIVGSSALFGSWDPEVCFPDRDLVALESAKYIELKGKVLKEAPGKWCSAEKVNLLMDLAVIARPLVVVEIGVYRGASALPVAAVLKYFNYGKLYAIDPWNNAIATRLLDPRDPHLNWWVKVDMEEAELAFQGMIKNWGLEPYCDYFQFPSNVMTGAIPQEIDVLHLDGDHSEVGALQDAELYLPMVKSGGYVLISHLNIMIAGKSTKRLSYDFLSHHCEWVCSIDDGATALFRKK